MPFSSIIGQPLAVDLATRWVARQSTHPLLFYGPEGVGKRTLALALSGVLNPGRAVRVHPDVRVIGLEHQGALREESIDKQLNLRIETILEERRRLLQSPVEGPWKVSIIDDAHRLTADAANVLLKILEEPPEQTALILLTPYRDRIFPTIQSRCQPVRFRPLSDKEMDQCLGTLGIPAEDRPRLMELALGSPGRALHWSRDEELKAAEEAEALWQGRRDLRPDRILSRAEGRGRGAKPGRSDIEQKLRHLLVPAVRELRGGRVDAARGVQEIEKALLRLRQNVQPALAYENCLLQLSTHTPRSASHEVL